MSNIVRKYNDRSRRRNLARLGSLAHDGLGSLGADTSTITQAVDVGLNVATDPYLPEMLCRVKQLGQIEKHKPVQACTKLPLTLTGGVGLRHAILPMRGYVYAQQHKWVYYVAAVGLIGLPILIGYQIGKSSK